MKALLKILTLFSVLFPLLPLQAHAAPAAFVDAATFFSDSPAYAAGVHALSKQFDEICGDTFCEGEYDQFASLGLSCSIATQTESIGQCMWTFAGASSAVDEQTGLVSVTHTVKVCELPIRGDAKGLLAFITKAGNAGPSFFEGLASVAVPGAVDGQTLMQVLSKCL